MWTMIERGRASNKGDTFFSVSNGYMNIPIGQVLRNSDNYIKEKDYHREKTLKICLHFNDLEVQ